MLKILTKNIKLKILFIGLLLIMNKFNIGQTTKDYGKIFIRNFPIEEYNAYTQNWAVDQDKRGVMYFANGSGVLEYDGNEWRLIKLPVNSSIRSIKVSSEGIIYVGTMNEFGYLYPDETGKMNYVSISKKLNIKDRNFGRIWKIAEKDQKIYFFTNYHIFIYDKETIKILKSSTGFFASSYFLIHGNYYFTEFKKGFTKLEGDSTIIVNSNPLFNNSAPLILLPYKKDKIIIGFEKEGLYLFDESTSSLSKWETKDNVDELIIKNRLYSGIKLDNNRYAIATRNAGTVIINEKGKILKIINEDIGLQSNTVYEQYYDHKMGLLWLALSNGISFVEIDSPIRYWDKQSGLSGSVTAIKNCSGISNKGEIFIGTQSEVDLLSKNNVIPFKNIKSQIWDFLEFKDSKNSEKILLITTNTGIYIIRKDKITKISDLFCRRLYATKKDPNKILIGNREGLFTLRYKQGKFTNEGKWDNIKNEVTFIEEADEELWLTTRYSGVYRIVNEKTYHYDTLNGLPVIGKISLLKSGNKLVFNTEKGPYIFNKKLEVFIPYKKFNEMYKSPVNIIAIDSSGNYWINKFGVNGNIEILKKDSLENLYQIIYESKRLDNLHYMNTIYIQNDSIAWIGTNKAVYSFNYKKSLQLDSPYKTLIRQVVLNQDSVVFAGTYPGYPHHSENPSLTFNYPAKSIVIQYASTYFINSQLNRFSTFLEGYDESWSAWSKSTSKEYGNLREGEYTFQVKAKNIYGLESKIETISFIISPPWYRTIVAYIAYAILAGLFIWLIVILNAKRLKALNIELEKIVAERTNDLHEVNTELEEKQAELEVQQEEILAQRDAIENQNQELEKLSIVASETDNAITIMDSQGNFEWFNDAYIKMCGYTLDEYKKIKGKNIVAASTNKNIKPIINECIKSKKTVQYESRIISKTGKKIWTQVTITPILDEDKKIKKLISIESDIGNLKEYEKEILNKNEKLAAQRDSIEKQRKDIAAQKNSIEKQNKELEKHRNKLGQLVKERTADLEKALKKAEESDRLKSAFLANMSHEIRTPMNAIVGFSDLLIDPDIDTDDKVDLSFRISQNCDSLLRLIDDIIDLAKIESEQLVIEKSEFKISDILDELFFNYKQIKSVLNKGHIELKINSGNAKSEDKIYTDKIRLKQIFNNLLDNALKFTEKGYIESGFTRMENEIEFYVKDTGIGLTKKQTKEIFNRFQKIENRSSNIYRGAGLGLSISKNIVELLGGKIWVESKSGKGSTFYFTIPKK